MYDIPLFDLNFGKEEEIAVIETFRSRWISTGPKCEEFENLFAEAIGTKFAVTTSNCTTALHVAVKILDIKEGDEVIVPSLTFAATANCVTYENAKPVFADITSLEDPTISPEDIAQKITDRTKAIIVMHFAGFPCNMNAIMNIAKEHNLYVIEDACHAPLSEYHGKKLGTFGDFACYSFFSNKNMSTGEGGMLVTNNESYFHKAKLLRSHGMTTMSYQRAKGHATEYNIENVGYNYRMDDIRASIGIVQLKKLRDDLKKRQEVRNQYVRLLSQMKDVVVPFKNNEDCNSNYILPIVIKNSTKENRNRIRAELHNVGIQTSVHYPCVHKFSCYGGETLPKSEYVADNEITLPMYSSLSSDEITYIVNSLRSIINE
ncbi:DegT/DnrJ/EryC1/StrS aminotransferase family protein [Draconibacterium sediminis]|uniref:DegT/DnrJ/EryC1/StrS family aminotransferase n=1 Tax=Draconibacterium sediminis TaxID=1544798 RepID=UPI0026EEC38E|nr:DegT/DnrJ/EryC1/StrS family aminotransferase [Draconibacterium sediminis]